MAGLTVSTSKRKKPLYLLILLGLVLLNGLMGIAVLISMHFSWLLACINTVIMALAVIGIAVLYRQWSFTWLAVVAMVGGIICGMYGTEYQEIKGRNVVYDISLKDAVDYPEAGGYYFTQGTVRTRFTGTYIKRTRDSKGHTTTTFFYAAPVTAENWTHDEPVTVWAVRGPGDNKKYWEQPFKAGIRARKIERDDLQQAVFDAIEKHGLRSHRSTILIHWVAYPETAAQDYIDKLLEAALIFNILWLASLVGGRVFMFFKNSKVGTDITEKTSGKKNDVSMTVLARILFTVFCLIAIEFSLFLSEIEFSSFLSITGLVLALVFFIIATATMQIAHHKEKKLISQLFWFGIYPFIVYPLIFFSFDYKSVLFWLIPGFFYFLSTTGGFFAGILIAPFIAQSPESTNRNASQRIGDGLEVLKKHRVRSAAGFLMTGFLGVLVYYFMQFLGQLSELSSLQTAGLYLFLFVSILAVIRFAYPSGKNKP